MADGTKLTLTCSATEAGYLDVARLRVTEAISDLYRVEVDTLTDQSALDIRPLLGKAALVDLALASGPERQFQGLVAEVSLMGVVAGDRLWHRLVLAPPLAAMALTWRSRCFLTTESDSAARKAAGVLKSALDTAVVTVATTATFGLSDPAYPDLASALQVNETDLDFLRRTAEHAGLGWFFPTEGEGKQIRFVDATANYPLLPGVSTFARSPRAILSATLTSRLAPRSVQVRSWDADHPATVLDCASRTVAASPGSPIGHGMLGFYEQGYTEPAVGTALANVRLDEAGANREALSGESLVLPFTPGYAFSYSDGDAPWLDGSYLLTRVTHDAWQSVTGAEALPGRDSDVTGYSNRYEAIPLANSYRPARRTPVPRITGLLRATVCDSTGGTSNTVAPYLDANGRYQVLLPFPDTAGKAPSQLFAPVRLMTPFGGSQERWHMPLRPGTTVFLAFEGGDVDRPIIAGLVPNREQQSPLPAPGNLHQSIIRTASGITMKLTDGGTLVVAGGASEI